MYIYACEQFCYYDSLFLFSDWNKTNQFTDIINAGRHIITLIIL